MCYTYEGLYKALHKMDQPKNDNPGPMTIAKAAAAIGVSPATVSAAFTGKGTITPARRRDVLEKARALGYRPDPIAQSLASGRRTSLVGLFTDEIDHRIGALKINTIQRMLAAQGYDAPIYASGQGAGEVRHAEMLANIRRQRPGAIVCAARHVPQEAIDDLAAFQASGGVVVCYDNEIEGPFDNIVFDREHNTYTAANHLLSLGHWRLGLYMASSINPDSVRMTAPRLAGFKLALSEYGGLFCEDWIFHSGAQGQFEEGGALTAAQFLALAIRPTGIVVLNDYAALSLIAALQRAGLSVPEDVSVIGHDDIPLARYTLPALSSVSHPVDEIATAVVAAVVRRLKGDTSPPLREYVRGHLCVRESTGAPKGETR